jgi:hypothetical protein
MTDDSMRRGATLTLLARSIHVQHMPPPFDHRRRRVPSRRIAARAGTGPGPEPGQKRGGSAREGRGMKRELELAARYPHLPLLAAQCGLDCQPRLDAGALPGDDTGNAAAHTIHRTSLGTLGMTMSWQMANWRPTVTERIRAIRKRKGEQKENPRPGRQRPLHRPGQGMRLLLPVITLGKVACKADSEGLRVPSVMTGPFLFPSRFPWLLCDFP